MAITPRSFLRNPLLLIGLLALAIPASVLAFAFTFKCEAPQPERVVVKRVMVPVAAKPIQKRVERTSNERGWLGVRIATMSPQLATNLGVAPNTRGVLVQQVFDNMPAKRAGFMPGDIITHFDGQRVVTACVFKGRVGAAGADADVRIRVLRHGTPVMLTANLTSAPDCGCKR